MTVRIIISRLNRKTVAKNTEKVKSTDQIQSFRWDCLWTGMEFLSLFPVNVNEQTSLKPLEKKVLSGFGCQKFIYCSDAELGSESIREFNHMGERTYIVTQSIKKLKKEEKEWAPKMLDSGSTKKNRKNPNDPARFIGKIAVTKDGEAADIKQYLDEDKIADDLHETCGFMTDYQFITKSKMRTIQNKSKGKE